MRVRVKICGVTSVGDAELCVALGADYVGLNFYTPRPRCLELSEAWRIAEAVRGRAAVVAVVADAAPRRVATIVDELGPDLVQFHGDETLADIAPWSDRALKALRVDSIAEAIRAMDAFGEVRGFLLDARHPTLLGGTGKSWHWGGGARLPVERTVFLAGGIEASNAAAAARVPGVYALDVCSGVESRPGAKSRDKLERLFRELRRAERDEAGEGTGSTADGSGRGDLSGAGKST